MSETTEEFMVRFRATGLHMLCEARRRDEQAIPWMWSAPITRTWRSQAPNWSQIPKDRVGRSDWKAARFMEHYHDPSSALFDFSTIRPSSPTGRIMTVRPEGPPVRILRDTIEGIHPHRDMVFISGRRTGLNYHRQAWAAALAALDFTGIEDRIAGLNEAFGVASQSLDEWVGSFGVTPYNPKPLPPPQSLGPGKEVEPQGERRVNPKRIAKDRLKKKLAKESKRK